MTEINKYIETWKEKLLDLGKRNKLIKYKDTKRSNIRILTPNYTDIFDQIVQQEQTLTFPFIINGDEEEGQLSLISENDGDMTANQSVIELQKTLRNLRHRAKTALEEQGVNILYLSFGFLEWKDASNESLRSPLVLIPAKLSIESITTPYKLSMYEEEVVVNPTLAFKLKEEYGLTLPAYDHENEGLESYFKTLEHIFAQNQWKIDRSVGLSLLSFLKINMYEDLVHNENKLVENPILKAIAGDSSEIVQPPEEYNNFDHDAFSEPQQLYQVLDADSSQLDAIMYAKKNVSYVLQGPPGTGKSQTITNVIAESLAEGKRVLFVSEKSAALEVVYKRLEQTKLSDFCLTLHSHKANKKEVLSELGKTLSLDKTQVREEALTDLAELKKTKQHINQYAKELHQPCPPLNVSLYETHGRLAKLQDIPMEVFQLENVGHTTKAVLEKYIVLLRELARTIGSMTSDYGSNPWRGCNVESLTHELRYNLDKQFTELIPVLQEIEQCIREIIIDYDLDAEVSYASLQELIHVIEMFSQSPIVPVEWMYNDDLVDLTVEAQKYKKLQTEYFSLKETIKKTYRENIFDVSAEAILERYEFYIKELESLLNKETYDSHEKIVGSSHQTIDILTRAQKGLETIYQACHQLTPVFDVVKADNLHEINKLCGMLPYLLAQVQPTEEWFSKEKYLIVKSFYQEARETAEELASSKMKVLNNYEKELLTLDANSMLKRFRAEYTSFIKYFKKSYWEDKKCIASYAKNPNNKPDEIKLLEIITLVKRIQDLEGWLKDNKESMTTYFGSHFLEEYTNWSSLGEALENFEHIRDYFGVAGVDQKTKEHLSDPGIHYDQVQSSYHAIKNVFEMLVNESIEDILEGDTQMIYWPKEKLGQQLHSTVNSLTKLSEVYEEMQQYAYNKQGHSQIMKDYTNLARMQEIALKMEKQSNELQTDFQYMYDGVEKTNWNEVLHRLNWTGEFRMANVKYRFTDTLIKKICTDEKAIQQAGSYLNRVKNDAARIEKSMERLNSLFDEQNSIVIDPLIDMIKRLEQCHAHFSALEEWIDFRRCKEACQEAGLGDYLEKIEKNRIENRMIENIFLKRFYHLWLDVMLSERPAVDSFRRKIHEDNIDNFCKLDKFQLEIATLRLRERLAAQLPETNSFTSSSDEVGILKRELKKKRRIMPLRRLFKTIPNLLMKLKPCLMMSPLSVSLFLDTDYYDFDIILFDEASQIRTEDAVGAIVRGKQIVIAGDSEQLPPTNFFAANTSDGAYDVDEEVDDEYNDAGAYESILDEANPVLPETTLRWHYRSKHEDLIAFSNRHLYNNKLITFPSSMQKVEDHGVEYIHVLDGVYDRSGKRDNRVEALKVAEIVFDHFEKHPTRSLGVVTFSEAQQQSVQAAIRQMRINKQWFENFFKEDREESFFVKNLENVQGDERDTIIFSIGYAKDQQGIMHMNFGPLSRQGGHRRLNVAVTRAKHNVKLVGSIKPTDIDLERTSAEGVRLLRSYVEYAITGSKALHSETSTATMVSTESPFEESVYDYISSHDYKVHTQVGCADYRIDMAIEHPTKSSRFVLGIECDGAMYHSTRTARERDRLRQTILEDMGWTIYRIWSTDWIKDPVNEKKRLIEAIDQAIEKYEDPTDKLIEEQHQYEDDTKPRMDKNNAHYVRILDEESSGNGLPETFVPYQETDVFEVYRDSEDTRYVANVVEHIVNTEYPIHEDELHRRIAPIFGQKKASKYIKGYVWNVTMDYLQHAVEIKDSFFHKKDATTIYVRLPHDESKSRDIKNISLEEISTAIYGVAKSSVGIMEEEVRKKTASLFGYKRLGENINIRLNQALDHLCQSKKIRIVDGKIMVD